MLHYLRIEHGYNGWLIFQHHHIYLFVVLTHSILSPCSNSSYQKDEIFKSEKNSIFFSAFFVLFSRILVTENFCSSFSRVHRVTLSASVIRFNNRNIFRTWFIFSFFFIRKGTSNSLKTTTASHDKAKVIFHASGWLPTTANNYPRMISFLHLIVKNPNDQNKSPSDCVRCQTGSHWALSHRSPDRKVFFWECSLLRSHELRVTHPTTHYADKWVKFIWEMLSHGIQCTDLRWKIEARWKRVMGCGHQRTC